MVTVSHKVLVATKDLNFARPAIFPTRKAINPLIFFFFLLSFYSEPDSQSGIAINSRGDTSLLLVGLSSLSGRNQ